MTAYTVVWCIVAGMGMIGLGVWYYGPNGPDTEADVCLCGAPAPCDVPGCVARADDRRPGMCPACQVCHEAEADWDAEQDARAYDEPRFADRLSTRWPTYYQ